MFNKKIYIFLGMFREHNRTDFDYVSEELSISLKASAKHLFLCACILSLLC